MLTQHLCFALIPHSFSPVCAQLWTRDAIANAALSPPLTEHATVGSSRQTHRRYHNEIGQAIIVPKFRYVTKQQFSTQTLVNGQVAGWPVG